MLQSRVRQAFSNSLTPRQGSEDRGRRRSGPGPAACSAAFGRSATRTAADFDRYDCGVCKLASGEHIRPTDRPTHSSGH